jgi:hypothetical protein
MRIDDPTTPAPVAEGRLIKSAGIHEDQYGIPAFA